jgi:uncharacterized protein YukE
VPRILVTPEHLSSTAPRLKSAADTLGKLEGQLNSILTNLDMEVRQRSDVDAQVQNARQQARALSQELAAMADYLNQKADTFIEADRQGSLTLGALPIPPVIQSTGTIPITGASYVVPVAMVLAAVPTANTLISSVPGIWGQVETWVRDRFSGFFQTSQPSVSISQPTGDFGALIDKSKEQIKPSSGFGALIDKGLPKEPTPASEKNDQGKINVDNGDTVTQWWADVPTKSQANLRYKGVPTAYGCTPTSTSMILDYWHAKNPSYKTISPQELLSINEKQDQFNKTGMSIVDLKDDLNSLGYKSTVYGNSDQQALKAAIERGPIIAVVRVNMADNGFPHAVVVTGISPTNQVKINDPLTGKSQTFTWEQFGRSWGSDFGKTKDGTPYATRSFSTVLPN